ncbi:DUF1993 domain-containing protein [Qipengyuania sp. 1XM1-15A]|uniref:DUF1993 family protein n=1 Tax=Qipengyuania xiamenensis TaxID=2867237 RepID=UPI001C86B1CE|nr:DUF1993 domain-containing protein [Qipengyuania xiamenensis]MBX7533938.1 DUF1993 domain-containing protein [Qipengyuania xiamenensis]
MTHKDLIVNAHLNMLGTLEGLLAKAASHEKGDELLGAKLADDMLPLSTQVRFLCNMPGEAMGRLIGLDFKSSEDDPETIADARSMIETRKAEVEKWSQHNFLDEDEMIELVIPNGMTFDLTAGEYVRDWAVPQFYFHATTAYAILRSEGLEIGKADFVGYMFKYLRQPAG